MAAQRRMVFPRLLLLLALCCGFAWPSPLEQLVYRFQHGTSEQRCRALRRIARDPSAQATEQLLQALEDRDYDVQLSAARLLIQRPADGSIPVLQDLTTHPSAAVRGAALIALGQQVTQRPGEAPLVWQTLLRSLNDPAAEVRAAAADAATHTFTRIQDGAQNELLAALRPLLSDDVTEVRVAALRALGRLQTTDHERLQTASHALVQAITPHLSDAQWSTREAAVAALGALHATEAIPQLARLAQDPATPDALAAGACLVIGQLGLHAETAQPSAQGALRTIAQGTTWPHNERGAPLRVRAALDALAALAEPAGLRTLLQALNRPELAADARQALVRAAHDWHAADETDPILSAVLHELKRGQLSKQGESLAQLLLELPAPHPRVTPAVLLALDSAFGQQVSTPFILVLARAHLGEAQAIPQLRNLLQTPDFLSRRSTSEIRLLARLSARLHGGANVAPMVDPEVEPPAPSLWGNAAVPGVLAALAQTPEDAQPPLLRLLGYTGSSAVPPLLERLHSPTASTEARLAAFDALASLGAPASRTALVTLVRAPELNRTIRLAAAHTLGTLATAADLPMLIELAMDRAASRLVRDAAVLALSVAVTRDGVTLGRDQRKRLGEQILSQVAQGFPGDTAAIIHLFGLLSPPDGIVALAPLLPNMPDAQRAATAQTLGSLPAAQARTLLRYLLLQEQSEVQLGALLGLAEVGNARDLPALLRIAHRNEFPLPAAVAYAIGRWLDRDAIAARTAARALCKLTRHRGPLLHANLAAALAKAAAGPCDPSFEPATLLLPERSLAERLAGARWLVAAAAAGRITEASAATQLSRCASEDPQRPVREVCRHATTLTPTAPSRPRSPRDTPPESKEAPPRGSEAAAQATPGPARAVRPAQLLEVEGPLTADGAQQHPRLVAALLADGSSLVARTTAGGRLLIPKNSPAVVQLFDPTLLPPLPPPAQPPAPQASR